MLLPILVGDEAFGAVAIWPPGGREPMGAALAELMEALDNAGPRLARALEADKRTAQASSDRLTGLANRRRFDELIAEVEPGAPGRGADLRRPRSLQAPQRHASAIRPATRPWCTSPGSSRGRSAAGTSRPGSAGRSSPSGCPRADLEVGMPDRRADPDQARNDAVGMERPTWPLSASFGVAACPETEPEPREPAGAGRRGPLRAKNSGRNRVEKAGGRRPVSGDEGQSPAPADRPGRAIFESPGGDWLRRV